MTSVRRVLSPVSPRRWPDLWGRIIPKPRRRLLILRLRYLSWRFHAPIEVDIHPSVRFGRRINVEVRPWKASRIAIGAGSVIHDDVRFRLWGGAIELGEEVEIRPGCILNITGGTITLDGPNVISWSVAIHCAERVHLKRWVYVGEYTSIVDSNHFYTSPDEWSYRNTRAKPIELGVDVWVCPKATITSGVTIGDRSIVGPNTVVVKDTPSGVLVSGVPGAVVRELPHKWQMRDGSGVESA